MGEGADVEKSALYCVDLPQTDLDLGPSNPAYGRQLLLQQQMVGLVVKAPLTDDKVSSCVLHLTQENSVKHQCHQETLTILADILIQQPVCVNSNRQYDT